jgi:hypothetical protein
VINESEFGLAAQHQLPWRVPSGYDQPTATSNNGDVEAQPPCHNYPGARPDEISGLVSSLACVTICVTTAPLTAGRFGMT